MDISTGESGTIIKLSGSAIYDISAHNFLFLQGASKLNISELLKDRCSCVSFEYSSLSAYDVLYLELHSNCNTTCFNFGKGKYNS